MPTRTPGSAASWDLAREQLTSARDLLAGTGLPYGSARAGVELGHTLLELGDPELTARIAELTAATRPP